MSNIKLKPSELNEMYLKGINLSSFLKNNSAYKDSEVIEISYDIQTGSYIDAMSNVDYRNFKINYTGELTSIINALVDADTVLEAGVGEATTLTEVAKGLKSTVSLYGFDMSWSRVHYAENWMKKNNLENFELCVGDMMSIPYADDSFDVVYTSHSVEPNGGNEDEILKELYRVTKKYLILLEPDFDLASIEGKARMESLGYCKDLKKKSESLGFNVLSHNKFKCTIDDNLNPTAITIIKKNPLSVSTFNYCCPEYGTVLNNVGGVLYSKESMIAYPILKGIPCLKKNNGIFAGKFLEAFNTDES